MMDPNQNNAYVPPPDPNVNPNPNTPLMDPQYAPPPQQPPTYNAQPQYGQPVATAVPQGGMPNTIVVNQQVPAVMINPNMFKTTPIAITCTFCNKPITTTVVLAAYVGLLDLFGMYAFNFAEEKIFVAMMHHTPAHIVVML